MARRPSYTQSLQQQQQIQQMKEQGQATSSTTKVDDSMTRLAGETLEELDWCLEQLETIQAHRSVGDMATIKFRRMLNKELSHFSETKGGSKEISEYIFRTFLGKSVAGWNILAKLILIYSPRSRQTRRA